MIIDFCQIEKNTFLYWTTEVNSTNCIKHGNERRKKIILKCENITLLLT